MSRLREIDKATWEKILVALPRERESLLTLEEVVQLSSIPADAEKCYVDTRAQTDRLF